MRPLMTMFVVATLAALTPRPVDAQERSASEGASESRRAHDVAEEHNRVASGPTVDEPNAPADNDDDAPTLGVSAVVTAARTEESATRATVATDVVDRAQIDRSGARDAAELLEERAGLQLQRSFRGSEVWLRGLAPEYTLVLLDGDRVPGRVGGAIDLSRYGVEDIERIEIVRGPSSALYGSDAIGGVINIIPRESRRDFEAEALASYGLGNVVDAVARVGGRPDSHLRLAVNGGLHYADAFHRGEGTATTGSSRLQWSAGGHADWRPSRTHRLRASADYLQLNLGGVDTGAGGAVFDRTQLQEQVAAALEHRIDTEDGVSLRTRVSYSQYREQYLLDQRGGAQLDQYEDNREHLLQLSSIFHTRTASDHAVTVGFDQLVQILDSERLSRSGRRARFSVFAQQEWVPVDEHDLRLAIVPGIRLDVDSQFGDQFSPKLAVRFDPIRQIVIRASYGRGFRAPSFQQLLMRFENPSVGYVVTGNPNLGAETAHSVDVGFEWSPDRALKFNASFFRNDLQNMIATVTIDDSTANGILFSYANIATAWTMGLESTAQLRVDEVLRATFGYTLTETWDGENQRHLEGRARHRFTLGLHLAYEPWEVELVGRAALSVDRVYYVDSDGDGTEEEIYPGPLAQVDLRLAKRFTRHFELFVGVDNLLDAGDEFTVLRPLTVYGGARGRY